MISLVLERAISSLKAHIASNGTDSFVGNDCAELLPILKVWTDWMAGQKAHWSPPPSQPQFDVG